MFSSALSYGGAPLLVFSILALIVGVGFLICGIVQDRKKGQ